MLMLLANRPIPINTKDGLYCTFVFLSMEPLQICRAYAEKLLEEKKFIKEIGVEEYLALD